MIEAIFYDVIGALRATFVGGDWLSLLIAFGSVIAAALLMKRTGQIASMTLLALALFAFGGYLRGLFAGAASEAGMTGARVAQQFEASLSIFMAMTASTLLAYFLAFMVMILIFFGARALFSRS